MAFRGLIAAALFGVIASVGACAQPEAASKAPASAAPVSAPDGAHRELVSIATAQGDRRFYAEIADDEAERARGLMFRREMARDHGMLFLFEEPGMQSFWMRNTHLSLDLIFVAADGRIVNIIEHATPYSDAPLRSSGPAVAVLEINAGLSRELGIAAGDRVQHPRIGAH
ncbi:MAG: DUF192 domain-containing protein [Terricaulis sp.]|nr:DUF192 domain-containing protein [Terricaulis sp.]